MSEDDRVRWNEKYRIGGHASTQPSGALTTIAPLLPSSGRALDVAGGRGRNAIWLARRGLDVCLADISDTALRMAESQAADAGVTLRTQQVDFEKDTFPIGPWNLIVIVHFLLRPLFDLLPSELADEGMLVCVHPTVSNLKRHEKPPAQFLLEDGELPNLVPALNVIEYTEGWLTEGRHEALIVATKPPKAMNER